MTVRRSGMGNWYFQVRTFAPESLLSYIRVRIELFLKRDEYTPKRRESPTFAYEGAVVSSELSIEESMSTGNYLMVNDAQVHCLKLDDTLFHFRVTVMITKPIENDA
jgi:hypothetical protein